jgi:hypothetical protein
MAHRKHHHSHRRRNPIGLQPGELSRIVTASAGYVAARAVPAMAMPSQNSGIMGYAMNAATAFLMKLVIPGQTGSDLFVGGAVATVTRIVSDTLGAKIAGLSGDPTFTLGAYWQSYFAVPTVSDPYGRVSASPYPAQIVAAAAAAGGKGTSGMGRGMSGSRFSGRFG